MTQTIGFGDYHRGPEYFYVDPSDAAQLLDGDSPLLRPGAERHILSVPECALEYLKLLSSGSIDLIAHRQMCFVLYRLHQLEPSPSNPWHEVRLKLIETLRILATKAGAFIEEHGYELEFNEETWSRYSTGTGSGWIQYGLSVAETLALKVFIEGFAKKFADPSRPADLCGEWFLQISKPQDLALSNHFSGIYDGPAHALITKRDDAPIWHLRFRGFPPLVNWFTLEEHAYQAVVPMLATIFSATVTPIGRLSD